MNCQLHSNKRVWYRFLLPTWLNCVTWWMDTSKPKIYRWLWWVYTIKQ